VQLREEAGVLAFQVADNGRGFELVAAGGGGHGFENMGDRLGAISGTFTLWSAPGKGTTVGGSVPVG
jgi:signal transduction histidine kinase